MKRTPASARRPLLSVNCRERRAGGGISTFSHLGGKILAERNCSIRGDRLASRNIGIAIPRRNVEDNVEVRFTIS